MNKIIYIILIANSLFAQINVLDHIMKVNNNNMSTEERKNLRASLFLLLLEETKAEK